MIKPTGGGGGSAGFVGGDWGGAIVEGISVVALPEMAKAA